VAMSVASRQPAQEVAVERLHYRARWERGVLTNFRGQARWHQQCQAKGSSQLSLEEPELQQALTSYCLTEQMPTRSPVAYYVHQKSSAPPVLGCR